MSDWDTSYDDDIYDNFSITTPFLEHISPFLVGKDMTDINIQDIERNSPVIIPPTQEQQQQQQQQLQKQTLSRTNNSAGGGGQLTKNLLNELISRTP